MNTSQIKRGEIYYAILDPIVGSEQDGIRPVLIVQNSVGNLHSPTTQIVPLTTQHKKSSQPTHLLISSTCGLASDSVALVEQLRTIDKSRLGAYIGRINSDEQTAIDNAIATSTGLVGGSMKKEKLWTLTLCERCKSDFEYAQYLLTKHAWHDVKEPCEYCQAGYGWDYGVFSDDGRVCA